MTVTDQLLDNNAGYVACSPRRPALPPRRKVAVLACMDARLDPARALGLDGRRRSRHPQRRRRGERRPDPILAISQRLAGTQEIILIHHTDCGMVTFTDGAVKDHIEADTGIRPSSLSRRSPTPTPM